VRSYKKRTISGDLVIVLTLAISLVITILGTAYYLHSTRSSQLQSEERASYVTDIFAEVLMQPLWNVDSGTIQRISAAYMNTESVAGIRVKSDYEIVFDEYPRDKKNFISRKKNISKNEVYLGTIEMLFSDENILQTQNTMISMILIVIFSMALVIILGTRLIMRSLLDRPLNRLISGIRNIAEGNYQTLLALVPQQDLNEIIHEVNVMASEIAKREEESLRLNKDLELRIVKQKEAEEELRKSRYYLKNIIDSMPSVIIGVNARSRVIHWNKAAETWAGLGAEDIQDSLIRDICPYPESEIKEISESLMTRTPLRMEKKAGYRQNEFVYEDIMIYHIPDGGAVIRVDDVTERVRIEEMMVQTEKMMSVGGLAAGMAHEINNPLSGILQGIQNTLRRVSPEFEKNMRIAEECGTDLGVIRLYLEKRGILKYLEGMRSSGIRASEIVSNMLNFSRRSGSEMAPADINRLLDSTVELAKNDYDLKKKYDFRYIRIIRDYDPHLKPLVCTATEIEQVILNLLKNAAQAMAEIRKKGEEPKIILRTRGEGAYIRIEVRDNGPGMDRKTRKRIFEPFYTTKNIGMGTGLGLSVSYFIITDNHKGMMSVESDPGKGAAFIIQLPSKQGTI